MYLTISAFQVQSNPVSAGRCWWPCNSRKGAIDLTRRMSAKADKTNYPNAFWAVDGNDKTMAAFLDGVPYKY